MARMTKKQRTNIVFIIIIGLIILVISQGGFNIFTIGGGAVCSGGQVLSIDDVSLRFSNELQKDVVRVLFSTVPTAECLDIKLTKSQLENGLIGEDEFKVTNGLIGDIRLTKKVKTYSINENQNNKLLKVGIRNVGEQAFCTDSDCTNAGISNPIASIFEEAPTFFDLTKDCFCVFEDQKGISADFTSSSNLQWEVIVNIENQLLTLNNNKLSGKVGNIAFVKWAGNLNSNDNLGTIDADSWKSFIDNNFRMIETGTFNLLNTEFRNVITALDDCDRGSLAGLSACPTQLNNARAYNSNFNVKTNNIINIWANREPLVSTASIVSNILLAKLRSPIVYPQFTLDIDAEEVGIFITTGKPQVSCLFNFNINSGQLVNKNLQLKNIGQSNGAFDYEITCNKGSQVLQPSPPQNINAGQTKTITGTFGFTVEEGSEDAICTFTATELNTLERDSCTFKYTSTHQSQCTVGSKSCELGNSQLWTCLEGGSFNKQSCKFGCGIVEGEATCLSEEDEEGLPTCESCDAFAKSLIFGSFIESQQCKPKLLHNTTICSLSILKFALVPIIFIFVSLFGFNFISGLGGIRRQKQGKVIALILSLIVAGVLAFLTFQLFFLGIILAIIVLIISIAFKGGPISNVRKIIGKRK